MFVHVNIDAMWLVSADAIASFVFYLFLWSSDLQLRAWLLQFILPDSLNCYVLVLYEGNYLVNYLANRGPELQPFVVGSLIQLLCRITKFGWFDDDKFRDVVKESISFLSQVTFFSFPQAVHCIQTINYAILQYL